MQKTITVGSRTSPLARAQVNEVLAELQQFHPNVQFDVIHTPTKGDLDQTTSLRTLGKTDFFTKEIDDWVLQKHCRIGIHSAKDLPDPIPAGLQIICLTEGQDSSDSLVLRPGETIYTLPTQARIATSSPRREECVKQLRSDLSFIDLRGTVDQRLNKLHIGEADGIVVAEAALIRLGLTHLNRIRLPGDTVEGQGQLAVLARQDDKEMADLFSCLDVRKSVLYLGLDPTNYSSKKEVIHLPIIQIIPYPLSHPGVSKALEQFHTYTHIIVTSKSAIPILLDYLKTGNKKILAVGEATAACLRKHGLQPAYIAENETSEGLVEVLRGLSLENAKVFWPHSALSRRVIADYLSLEGVEFCECVVYETVPAELAEVPSLEGVGEIVFTSPSTVDAFLYYYGSLPRDKKLTSIGPVTAKHLTFS